MPKNKMIFSVLRLKQTIIGAIWQCISNFHLQRKRKKWENEIERSKTFIHAAALIQWCTFHFIYLIYQNILIVDDISLCCIIPSLQKWVIMMVWWWSTVVCSKIPISRLGIAMIDREILLCHNKRSLKKSWWFRDLIAFMFSKSKFSLICTGCAKR